MRSFTPLVLGLLLTACSPTCRLELRFLSPVGPLDPARFYLAAAKACPPGPVPSPPPGLGLGDAEWQTPEVVPRGLHVETAFHGIRCAVRVTGFYDTNANGKVDAGDLTGSSPALEVVDRGIFAGNLTTAADVRLLVVR